MRSVAISSAFALSPHVVMTIAKGVAMKWCIRRGSIVLAPRADPSCRAMEPTAHLWLDQRRNFPAHARVIGVEPGDFFAVEKFWLDERKVERRQRQRLEIQHLAFGARDLPALDPNQIFDPDAKMPGM